jgi:hypothetical protein
LPGMALKLGGIFFSRSGQLRFDPAVKVLLERVDGEVILF